MAHGFSHDTALFGVSCPQPFYPLHFPSPHSSTHHRSGPSAIVTPETSLSSGPYPGGSGMSTVTHPPEMQEFSAPHGTLRRPLHGLQPQTTIASATNFRGLGVSTITHPPRPLLHGVQHHSTIPDVPNLGGYGLSSDTLQPQIPELRASYGTPSPSLHELQPHHTFPDASYLSGFGLSTVTHLPGISGRSSPFGTTRPPQYELQPQSVIPGDPHLSDPATSSVTHPSVIRFPSDRPRHETHSQNVIPGVSYLGGPGEKVETRTVSKKTLPTSIRQLPEKKDYQGGIFRDIIKTGNGKMKNGNKTQLEPQQPRSHVFSPTFRESVGTGRREPWERGWNNSIFISNSLFCTYFSFSRFPFPVSRFPFPAPFTRFPFIVTSNILVLELKQLVLCSLQSFPENGWSIKNVLIVIISF